MESSRDTQRSPFRAGGRSALALGLLILVAMLLRLAVIGLAPQHLGDDRDAYLGIARELQQGHGFATPAVHNPTAYRPPLYPLLLAAVTSIGPHWPVAALHILLAAATVWLTYSFTYRGTDSPWAATAAAAFVSVDPLLVWYASFPMTETLCATLSAALLVASLVFCSVSAPDESPSAAIPAGKPHLLPSMFLGMIAGLCVLSRPSYWAPLVLMAAASLLFRHRGTSAPRAGSRLTNGAIAIGTLLVVIAPWVVRNTIVLGTFRSTTTHGGYTLLLANNDAFYDEVVEQPWGTVWDGSRGPGQAAWFREVLAEMSASNVQGEVDQDRWMTARAVETIQKRPTTFLRACLLRFVRFWNVLPLGTAAESVPRPLLGAIAGFYIVAWGLAIVGVIARSRRHLNAAIPAAAVILGFMTVHLVFWTNARMRAPILPALAFFIGLGLEQTVAVVRRRWSPSTRPAK